MTKEELAAKITGREYPFEITREEKAAARAVGLVVIHGDSDDLLEFRGALEEELGAWNGTSVTVTMGGKIVEHCEHDGECPYFKFWLEHQQTFTVKAKWCPKEPKCSWLITATVPGAAFDIIEDGQLYCRGLVIDLAEVKKALEDRHL